MRVRVKVCCISSREEADLAVHLGADAVGLVTAMPSGPGVIDDALAQNLATSVPPGVAVFLLTSLQSADAIIAQARFVGAGVVQIVDQLTGGSHADIRAALPGVKLVQVVHVQGEASVAEAQSLALSVDALLLDSGSPSGAVKTLGGTGQAHDWKMSRRIVETVSIPVWLAGGLHAGNVRQAVEMVEPFGVDVCSGVRANGMLDAGKLAAFLDAARGPVS